MVREYRELDEVSEEDAVRLVFEAAKPIACKARDLGVNEGALDRVAAAGEDPRRRCGVVQRGRPGRAGADAPGERRAADAAWTAPTSGGPLGRRCDDPVAVAVPIAAGRDRRDGRHTIACRALGAARRGSARRYTAPPPPARPPGASADRSHDFPPSLVAARCLPGSPRPARGRPALGENTVAAFVRVFGLRARLGRDAAHERRCA